MLDFNTLCKIRPPVWVPFTDNYGYVGREWKTIFGVYRINYDPDHVYRINYDPDHDPYTPYCISLNTDYEYALPGWYDGFNSAQAAVEKQYLANFEQALVKENIGA